MTDWIKVATAEDFIERNHIVVDIDETDVIIFKLEQEYYALEDVCSHDGGEISEGHIEDCCIVCPRHGAKFDIKTGEVKSAPAYEDIESFQVKHEEGTIYLKDHRW